jgi:hypothetical protein
MKNKYYNHTIKLKKHKIYGHNVEIKEGWKIIHIYGNAYERGFAHGYLLHKELKRILKSFPFVVKRELKISFTKYLNISNKIIKPVLKGDYLEFYEEIRGISNGAKEKGVNISVGFIIAWNAYMSLYSYIKGGSVEDKTHNSQQRCSAFIATGHATENGDIVMCHSTHSDFITGQLLNIIMYVKPDNGNPFMMQCSAGYISSVSDWFICDNGIIGCETTISKINYKPTFGSPSFCRIRQVMQYANNMEDCITMMKYNNSGDYACSWLFGNVHTNEIMLFEVGKNIYNIKRTKNGVFYGMNSAINFNLRTQETDDKTFYDIKYSSGARNARLDTLLNTKYYGKINVQNAKAVISDHYDVYLNKEIMNNRSICKHTELDEDKDNYPFGATDAKVVNSEMAKHTKFMGRFGSGCGRAFNLKSFVKAYPKYKQWEPHLLNIPKYEWTLLDYCKNT